MKIKINYNLIYIYSILFLVSGMSIIAALNFLYQITFDGVYINIFIILSFLFLIGLFSKKLRLNLSNYVKLFIFFFVVVSLSYLLTDSSEYSNRKYFLFFGSGLLLTIYSSAIKQDFINILTKGIIFYALVNIVIIIFFLLNINDVSELKWLMIKEIGVDVIYMSRVIGLGIVAVFFYVKNISIKIFLSFFFILPMFYLNEVGPLLAVFLSLFFYYSRKNLYFLFLSTISGTLFYFFFIKQFIPDLTLDEILNNPRVEIYDTHFNFFLNNPIIGIGIAGSENILYSYQSSHNIFIEIASEFGILGLIPFSGMIILLINKYLISKDFSFSYLWLYTFIVVQFSGDVSLNSIFWFVSAVYMIMPKSNDINSCLDESPSNN